MFIEGIGNCGCGLEQKEEFRMKKQPHWGNKNFLMLYWIEDELFVTDKVVEQFQSQNIKGTTYLPVKKFKTDDKFNNIQQIKVNTILGKGLILDDSEIREKTICEKCNEKKYVVSGRNQFIFKKVP